MIFSPLARKEEEGGDLRLGARKGRKKRGRIKQRKEECAVRVVHCFYILAAVRKEKGKGKTQEGRRVHRLTAY